MENKLDQPQKTEEQEPILEMGLVKEFVRSRNINPEDFHLIEELAFFPKNLIIAELHNLFNMSKEKSGVELEGLMQNTQDEIRKNLYRATLEFYNKYGWMVSLNLVRTLERK